MKYKRLKACYIPVWKVNHISIMEIGEKDFQAVHGALFDTDDADIIRMGRRWLDNRHLAASVANNAIDRMINTVFDEDAKD